MLDIAIVGGGPAGLAAGVKAATEGLAAAVFEKGHRLGGRPASSPLIENIPGFDRGVTGPVFAESCRRQAERFGCRFRLGAEVLDIQREPDFTLALSIQHGGKLHTVEARSVLLCLGLAEGKLPGDTFKLCRSSCDPAELSALRGGTVAFVGGGNSSAQLAIEAAELGAKVTLIARKELVNNVSAYLLPRIERAGVEVLIVDEVGLIAADPLSDSGGKRLWYVDREIRQSVSRPFDHVFAFPGGDASASTRWLPDAIARNDTGHILIGPDVVAAWRDAQFADLDREPHPYETSLPGVFAAGDVTSQSMGSIAAAMGTGTHAVQVIYRHYLPEPVLPGGVLPQPRN